MKTILDLLDRKILFELDKNSRLPASRIAKNVAVSREKVAYRIDKLQEKGVIKAFKAIIDPGKMGYQLYKLHFKLGNDEQKKEEFFNYLQHLPTTYWIGKCTTLWDTICSVFVKDPLHLYQLMHGILFKFRDLIQKKEVVSYVQGYFFHKSFLTGELAEKKIITEHLQRNILDDTDKKIVIALSKNCRLSLAEVSTMIGVKNDVVPFRMKRLEKKGIILGYRVHMKLESIGMAMYKVFIRFYYRERKRHASLHEYLSRNKNLSYYLKVVGPWDAEASFIVENHQQIVVIVEDLQATYADLIKTCDIVLITKDYWMPYISLE